MHILMDTHTFLWFLWADPQLSVTARTMIEDETNEKFISLISLWEIALKVSVGKLTLAKPFEQYIREQIALNGFEILPLRLEHIAQVVSLPFHHRDPFDRLLAAQSLVEAMPLLSIDAVLDPYGLTRLW